MYIEIAAQEFCDYSKFIKGYSTDTIRRYRQTVALFCRNSGAVSLPQVTDEMARSFFFKGRIEGGWRPATFKSYHQTLFVFFRWCVLRQYLTSNPVSDIEVPKLEKKLPTRLTKQDALKLLEFVYNYPYEYKFLRFRNHAIFATYLFAGLRKSELLHLRVTDVDIENLTIFVNQGKGGKDRIVPISFTLAHSLRRYIEERKRLKRICPEFFVSLNRDMGFTVNGLKHLTEDLKKASHINFGIHKLRHTFATLMLEGGCDIYSLSRMMGHSDIKTTTIYLSASAEHLRSQITKHPLNGQPW
jgi:site-specific recombinase XerD